MQVDTKCLGCYFCSIIFEPTICEIYFTINHKLLAVVKSSISLSYHILKLLELFLRYSDINKKYTLPPALKATGSIIKSHKHIRPQPLKYLSSLCLVQQFPKFPKILNYQSRAIR